MKTKKISKKLNVNKETVVNLSAKELNSVKGGTWITNPRYCPSGYMCP